MASSQIHSSGTKPAPPSHRPRPSWDRSRWILAEFIARFSKDFGQRNLSSARTLAFAASSSRFFAGDFDARERSKRSETIATSSIAVSKGASFTFDGLLNPLIFLTNCREAARISSSVAGGSKLKRGLMFLHTCNDHTRNGRGPLKEVCPSATRNLSPVP